MRKPLRVWLFYWVPAFAGTTNVGFLHSLIWAGTVALTISYGENILPSVNKISVLMRDYL